MRLKYYLRGMGIGITFATLILTLSFYFGKDYLVKDELTDEEIIEKATELGMTMPEDMVVTEEESEADAENPDDATSSETTDAESTDSEAEVELVGEDEIVAENAVEETPKSTSKTNEAADDKTSTKDDAKTSDKEAEENTDTKVTYIPFSIKPGESSEVICAHLYKAKLIDSSKEFNKYLNKLNVDDKVSTGTFYIQEGSSYDDIVALLVNKSVRMTSLPKAQEAPKAPEIPKTPKAGE